MTVVRPIRALRMSGALAALVAVLLVATGGAVGADAGPANDDIVNAFTTNLTGGNGGIYTITGTVSGATSDQPFDVVKYTDKKGPHLGGSSVWYRVPNPGPGRLRIHGVSKHTDFDAVVAVYHGPAGGILTPADLAPGPDGGNGQRFGTRKHSRRISVATEPGYDYVVVVDGYGGVVSVPISTFTIRASFTPQ